MFLPGSSSFYRITVPRIPITHTCHSSQLINSTTVYSTLTLSISWCLALSENTDSLRILKDSFCYLVSWSFPSHRPVKSVISSSRLLPSVLLSSSSNLQKIRLHHYPSHYSVIISPAIVSVSAIPTINLQVVDFTSVVIIVSVPYSDHSMQNISAVYIHACFSAQILAITPCLWWVSFDLNIYEGG